MRCSYLNFDISIKAVAKKGVKKIVTSLHERNCRKEFRGKRTP